jgi:hypothetical protein
MPFSKVSTMGIKGVLPADIGQLTDLQSLYVAAQATASAKRNLFSTISALEALLCIAEP